MRPPLTGSITIGGIDIQNLPVHLLRQTVTLIPQEPFLFIGTVRENLDPCNTKTDEEIFDALRSSGAFEFVANLEGKLEHQMTAQEISAMPAGLQQQLCLCRAFLSNGRIMILDEISASVDQETEHLIIQSISELSDKQKKTIIMIAHGTGLMDAADRIIHLHD
jgi:ABC-type multidrug transport system fused ATPase/permease subunit